MGASGGGWRHGRHGERRRKDFFRKQEHDDDNNNHIRGKEGVLRSQLREIHHAYAPGRSACRHSLRGLVNWPRRGPCRRGSFKGLTAAGARKFCLVRAPHAAPPAPGRSCQCWRAWASRLWLSLGSVCGGGTHTFLFIAVRKRARQLFHARHRRRNGSGLWALWVLDLLDKMPVIVREQTFNQVAFG